MNGVDAIVFTAGIGENNAQVRALISQYTGFLGCEIDLEKNKAAVGVEADYFYSGIQSNSSGGSDQ